MLFNAVVMDFSTFFSKFCHYAIGPFNKKNALIVKPSNMQQLYAVKTAQSGSFLAVCLAFGLLHVMCNVLLITVIENAKIIEDYAQHLAYTKAT